MNYTIDYVPDYDSVKPWLDCDCHGAVRSGVTRDNKRPGEVLFGNGHASDFAESTRIAKRDRWGVSDAPAGLTPKQITALAVQHDFDYLRAWANDEWHYASVIVSFNGKIIDSLSGVEYWEYENAKNDYAREIAQEMIETHKNAQLRESIERQAWAERDGVTV